MKKIQINIITLVSECLATKNNPTYNEDTWLLFTKNNKKFSIYM